MKIHKSPTQRRQIKNKLAATILAMTQPELMVYANMEAESLTYYVDAKALLRGLGYVVSAINYENIDKPLKALLNSWHDTGRKPTLVRQWKSN